MGDHRSVLVTMWLTLTPLLDRPDVVGYIQAMVSAL